MPNQEDIMQQQNLLQIHRRTLYDYLSRQGRMGQANAPAEVTYGIDNSRKEIRRIKNILRAWGEYIEDLPDDEEAGTSTAPRIKDVDIAIVVVAMTQSEATGLFSVLSDQTTSINSHNFNEIKLLFDRSGIDVSELYQFYGDRREDWIPYLDMKNSSSIHHILDDLINNINQAISNNPNTLHLRLKTFSEEFFSNDFLVRRRCHSHLSRSNCIFIIDPISLFHPELTQTLSHCGMGHEIALLMLSPIDLSKLNKSIEEKIVSHIPWAITRYEEIFLDNLCELHIGDPLAFQRRFFSVIMEVANQQPKMHPTYRDRMVQFFGQSRGSSEDWLVR